MQDWNKTCEILQEYTARRGLGSLHKIVLYNCIMQKAHH